MWVFLMHLRRVVITDKKSGLLKVQTLQSVTEMSSTADSIAVCPDHLYNNRETHRHICVFMLLNQSNTPNGNSVHLSVMATHFVFRTVIGFKVIIHMLFKPVCAKKWVADLLIDHISAYDRFFISHLCFSEGICHTSSALLWLH